MESAYPILSSKERDRRWAMLRVMMSKRGLSALVLFGLKGRERYDGYISNEYIEGMSILPLDSDPVLLTWHPKMAVRRMGSKTDRSRFWIDDIRFGKYGPGIVAFVKERGLERSRIGVVGLTAPEANGSLEGIVPFPLWAAVLAGLPEALLTDVTDEIKELMLVKSEEELVAVRYCARVGERACGAMLDAVKPGVNEYEIYEAVQGAIHKSGASVHDPYLIMTWGSDDIGWAEPAWAYYGGAPRIVEPGDLIMAELFPTYAGLETQQQMSIAVGPLEAAIEELGVVARASYEAGVAAAKPGTTLADVVAAMLEPVRCAGCWTFTPMIHSVAPLGWPAGIGFNSHLMPAELAKFAQVEFAMSVPELVLREGMTFAFEPNACKQRRRVNVGGTVVITADGAVELNRLPNNLNVV